MNRPLPEQIVAVVETLAEELADWCVAGRDRTLEAHEAAVLERVRRARDAGRRRRRTGRRGRGGC